MTNERRVIVHPDAASLAASAAARFITKVIDLLDEKESIDVCLTGGSTGIAVPAAIATTPARDIVVHPTPTPPTPATKETSRHPLCPTVPHVNAGRNSQAAWDNDAAAFSRQTGLLGTLCRISGGRCEGWRP